MTKETFETSLASGGHSRLARLVGEWTGSSKLWFEPTTVEDEAPVTAIISSLMGGRYIRIDYESSYKGKPLSGSATYGYHLGSKKVQASWINSFHTGLEILYGEGELTAAGFTYTVSYFAGPDQPRWKWRTEVELKGENELILTAYNISPEGEEAKALETIYTRKR